MIWALVPAKLSTEAKARLDPLLSPPLRAELARAMLADVLLALRGADALCGIAVISRDREMLELGARAGATPLLEVGNQGLNAAVAQGVAACRESGATGIVIAMGDLPLLSPAEVRHVIERLPERGVVLVPSADGKGTNVLAERPAGLLPTAFGQASLEAHSVAAASRGIDVVIERLPGAALDVDTDGDLARLIATTHPDTATARLLGSLGRPTSSAPSAYRSS